MSHSIRRPVLMGATASFAAALLVLGAAAPAFAGSVSGTRTCTPPKEVALYSDQIGSGFHYYQSGQQLYTTSTPPGVRQKFNSFGGYSQSAWTVNAATLFVGGSTCI